MPPGWLAGRDPPGPGGEPRRPAALGAGRAPSVHGPVDDGAAWLWRALWRIVCWGTERAPSDRSARKVRGEGHYGPSSVRFQKLSWASYGFSASLAPLTETRKSHPLEGSCQEAIRPLYTTFDIFSRCVPIGTLHPRCVISDASVFSLSWRRLRCAAPATHQDQGALTSRVLARRLPLARSVPQKTLGSLPCPIGYISQMSWLPRGSNFSRAH